MIPSDVAPPEALDRISLSATTILFFTAPCSSVAPNPVLVQKSGKTVQL
jgi:hypothetical protein